MKLEKITKEPVGRARRYHDACGAAHGLDLIGERWALLVIRELMMGPRRFSDLRKDLCGISANVLTQRLEGLEASGIVQRRKLPPPASVQVYELTDWGYEIKPVFMVLGRWAARSPEHDPTLPLSASSLMLSMRTMFQDRNAWAEDLTIGFQVNDELFRARVKAGTLKAERGEAEGADVVVTASPEAIAGFLYGGAPLPEGAVRGDAEALARYAALFELPNKAGA